MSGAGELEAELVALAVQEIVDAGELAGAATLVFRDRDGISTTAVGRRDIAADLPMQRDTIFRIASMSKPITSVAALALYDEGRFDLEDPITDWAPEFAQMRVMRSLDGALDDTVPAGRPITFNDLLTHRAGLTYGAFHPGVVAGAYYEALGADIDSHRSPDEWIAKLASLPLIDQPGVGFHYGVSTDLLGLLIARMEGRPLGEVLAHRVFEPLGMTDTGFRVPPEKQSRRATMYGFDADGRLEARPAHPKTSSAFLAVRPDTLTFESGGAGLWSTLDDYLAFARLFIGEGAVDGVRILKIGTLRRMTTNFLSEAQIADALIMAMPVFAGQGFGLGVAVVLDPARASATRCKGGVGTVGWPGAFGGWWQADPTDGSILIFLSQNALDPGQSAGLSVFSAILEFHSLCASRSW